MLVLIGASASGKTEVAKILIKNYGYTKIITNTTRKQRQGETNGVDYYFHNTKDFLKLKKECYFIETAFYDGNYYGTAFQDVKTKSVLIVEPNGANSIINAKLKDTIIIYFDASEETRFKRMKERGDDIKKINERIKGDRIVFSTEQINHIDYIVNTNIKTQQEIAEELNTFYLKELSHD